MPLTAAGAGGPYAHLLPEGEQVSERADLGLQVQAGQGLRPEVGCGWVPPCQPFPRGWEVRETASPGHRARKLGDGREVPTVATTPSPPKQWPQGAMGQVLVTGGTLTVMSVPSPEDNLPQPCNAHDSSA